MSKNLDVQYMTLIEHLYDQVAADTGMAPAERDKKVHNIQTTTLPKYKGKEKTLYEKVCGKYDVTPTKLGMPIGDGSYKLTRNSVLRGGAALDSPKLQMLQRGQVVDVVEVTPMGNSVRVRITVPEGWFTIAKMGGSGMYLQQYGVPVTRTGATPSAGGTTSVAASGPQKKKKGLSYDPENEARLELNGRKVVLRLVDGIVLKLFVDGELKTDVIEDATYDEEELQLSINDLTLDGVLPKDSRELRDVRRVLKKGGVALQNGSGALVAAGADDDEKAGSSVLDPSKQELVAIEVPEGKKPGDKVQFFSPSGRRLETTIPEGHNPGATFMVDIKAAEAEADQQKAADDGALDDFLGMTNYDDLMD